MPSTPTHAHAFHAYALESERGQTEGRSILTENLQSPPCHSLQDDELHTHFSKATSKTRRHQLTTFCLVFLSLLLI
ncbi:hypothetical protein NCU00312 [Neurospora crassa OR74A]|uniref:Uncharacterized protein n=1 Tax=Neurospora crassa (strain ATCC 24698 / 74-OR23-1A / CBS 708.71 / DSM 1257 / FGSC 987) TaxID=367110 RepID=Q7RZQ2_NEUCR|nr:hypothetical protein NCU00312 [Neurospora crassa OR74A]EAA28547.2 hypothetical protein NCU00312 [Neurospora crassa OR74A]|eukprot:XP_957783.2 hypothetical protein NCU00312 [Neurospora crassa OR74A]